MTKTITLEVPAKTFEDCVGRPPNNDAELEGFVSMLATGAEKYLNSVLRELTKHYRGE
jgi:hypothetical protein